MIESFFSGCYMRVEFFFGFRPLYEPLSRISSVIRPLLKLQHGECATDELKSTRIYVQQFSNKSQVIRDFFSFALHRIMIGPENSRSTLLTNQNQN